MQNWIDIIVDDRDVSYIWVHVLHSKKSPGRGYGKGKGKRGKFKVKYNFDLIYQYIAN